MRSIVDDGKAARLEMDSHIRLWRKRFFHSRIDNEKLAVFSLNFIFDMITEIGGMGHASRKVSATLGLQAHRIWAHRQLRWS